MSNYKPYESYKDSGVEWLGEVPNEWGVKPLMSVAIERKTKNTGNIESNVLSLSYGNIIRRSVDTDFGLLPASFETYQLVESDNIIMRLTDLQNDQRSLRTGRAKERGIITSAYLCLRPLKSIDSRYLHYLLHAYDIQKIFYSMGGGVRQSMGFDDLRRLPVTIPSPDEQQTIAAFLDRETARIDTLIEKKQRQIELLKEKRQAIITQAVTKGLDPDAPMKDSGVEWLGEVPEHWVVSKIGNYSAKIGSGKTPSGGAEVYSEEGVAFLRSQNVYDEGMYLDELVFISDEIHREMLGTQVLRGDVLLNITGGSLGRCCVVDHCILPANVNQHVCIIRPTKMASSDYLAYSINSKCTKSQMQMYSFSGNREGLNFEEVKCLMIVIPPTLNEQTIITEHIKIELNRIDSIEAKTQLSTKLLKERRSALITAAVTGQIDVRGK